MAGDMSRWMGAVSDIKKADEYNKKPPLFKKIFNANSVEEEAMQIFMAKKKAEDMRNQLKKKAELNKKLQIIKNLRLILSCKFITGIVYIKALLLKFKLVKEVFIYEIEKGNETIIPLDLSQDKLPLSYRYYDSIIAIIFENISNSKRATLASRQKLAYLLHS